MAPPNAVTLSAVTIYSSQPSQVSGLQPGGRRRMGSAEAAASPGAFRPVDVGSMAVACTRPSPSDAGAATGAAASCPAAGGATSSVARHSSSSARIMVRRGGATRRKQTRSNDPNLMLGVGGAGGRCCCFGVRVQSEMQRTRGVWRAQEGRAGALQGGLAVLERKLGVDGSSACGSGAACTACRGGRTDGRPPRAAAHVPQGTATGRAGSGQGVRLACGCICESSAPSPPAAIRQFYMAW